MDSKDVQKILHDMVEHEVGHAVDSHVVQNRMIGEAMRHIGKSLTLESGAYLSVRHEEVLVKPERMAPDSDDGVVLIRRQITMANAYLVMANITTVEGKRHFDIWAYKPDEFDLSKTTFLMLPEPVGNEIIRQLAQIVKNDGAILVQVVSVPDMFKNQPRGEQKPASELFDSQVQPPSDPYDQIAERTSAELETTEANGSERLEESGGLPMVNHSLL